MAPVGGPPARTGVANRSGEDSSACKGQGLKKTADLRFEPTTSEMRSQLQWHSPPPAGKMGLMQPAIAKFRTHQEAEAATLAYYRRLSPAERLEILFTLRVLARKEEDASSERLARVYRIAQLQRG